MFITAFTRARHLVPNPTSTLRCSGRTEKSVRFRRFLDYFVTWLTFYGNEFLASRPIPKLEDHTLLAVRDCLFNIFASVLHIWRPFLYPQPQDAPCRGYKDPLITGPPNTPAETWILTEGKLSHKSTRILSWYVLTVIVSCEIFYFRPKRKGNFQCARCLEHVLQSDI